MKKKLLVFVFVLAMLITPVMVGAQVTSTGSNSYGACGAGTPTDNIQGLLCKIGNILNAVVPVLIALGVVYFVWGVITYVIASDEEAKKSGRNRIIYGIIGLAVIVAVWGLVRILTNTFGISNNANITLPTI